MNNQTISQDTKWQRRKESRPAEIIEAALELFVANGFKATKLDDVAKQAGVSKGTVYLYFENKEALFREVVSQIIVPELIKAEQLAERSQGSQSELLSTMIFQWWSVIGKTRLAGIPKIMISEAANFPELAKFYLEEVISRGRKIITSSLKKGMLTGEFSKCNPVTASRLLISPVIFAVIWKKSLAPFDKERYDEDAYIQMHLDFFLNGLRVKKNEN